MTGGVSRQFHRTVVAFEDEVSTESGSDRVIVLAISIIAIGFYPVATALGTDSMTSGGFLPQIRPLPFRSLAKSGAIASGCKAQVESMIPSHPPSHARCPRGDPGPLRVLIRPPSRSGYCLVLALLGAASISLLKELRVVISVRGAINIPVITDLRLGTASL